MLRYKVSFLTLSKTMLNSKVDPLPSSDCVKATIPPIFSQKRREIESPSPVPPYFRVFPVSNWPKGCNSM